MKRLLLLATLFLWLPAAAQVNVASLKVNHMTDPSGVTDPAPVFSWVFESGERNVMQTRSFSHVYLNKQASNY